jgi:hypothetical protein
MDFILNIDIKRIPRPITYKDKILLIGSCFTEHIGNSLEEVKFSVLQNPNGILFDPNSVSRSLLSYIDNEQYSGEDFFKLNDVWHSWKHHSRFSNTNLGEAVRLVNQSQERAHQFLKYADWVVVTLGSSFSYRLTSEAAKTKDFPHKSSSNGQGVSNCHRAPANWFNKHLMTIDEIIGALGHSLTKLFEFNSKLNVILTVSPVRHARDGVVENNRSKARLIESAHELVNRFDKIYYFPAYELVIDILRDYRFYDIDLVHPNYMATEFVLEKFAEACIEENTQKIMQEVKNIVIARKHRAFQPATKAHQQFLESYAEKAKMLREQHPFLNLEEELIYFNEGRQIL